MGNTSLTVGGYTFVFNQGDIDEIRETITTGVEHVQISKTGPMGSLTLDYDGVKKVVKISGALTEASTTRVSGYTVTTILAQKQWLESLLNGDQSEIELTDDYAGQSILSTSGPTPPYLAAFTSTKAYAGMATFWRKRGDPNKHYFEITLLVGDG